MKKKSMETRLALGKKTIVALSGPEHLKAIGGGMNSSFTARCPFGCVPESDFCESRNNVCQTLDTIMVGCKTKTQ